MGSFSNYLENALLDHVTGVADLTSLTDDVHIALATAEITDVTTGATMTEVANTFDYARVTTTSASDWDAAAGGAIANAVAITFPPANGGAWGTVTYFAALDSATHGAGNILFWGALSVGKVVSDGDTVEFAVGDIDVTLD